MGKGIGMLFEYETQKIVQINSTKVGVINRIIQLLIIGYIVCWVMIYEKGYQDTDTIVSAVTTKVKGVGYTNMTKNSNYGLRSWDVADYIVPPQENNAFFVVTNAILTPKQTPGLCTESPDVREARCNVDSDCPKDKSCTQGSGLFTGKCLEGLCEIRAWCPVENDTDPIKGQPLFPMVANYTVLIKNDIEFQKFKVRRRNVLDWAGKKFLYSCHYDQNHQENKFCPIIKLGTIFQTIGDSKGLLYKGGTVAITIDWNCNLDWDIKFCNPTYTFRRLDDKNAKIAKGFNFRYANYYRINNTEYRDLIKAYGVRFLIFVTGKAGKFSVLPLSMNLGSGLALLGLASVLCDMIVLHVLGSKKMYRSAKFETVEKDRNDEDEIIKSAQLIGSESKDTNEIRL